MLREVENLLQAEIDPSFAQRARFILRSVERQQPRTVLDIGCGRGFYLQATSLYDFPAEIHGIDIKPDYVERARRNCTDPRVAIQQGDVYGLPYPDGFFDLVICSEVLEHVTDDRRALLEIKRVLRAGGTLLLTVPNRRFPFLWDPLNWVLMRLFHTHVSKDIWWLAGMWADHERLYTREAILSLAGSEFEGLDPVLYVKNCWPFTHFILYGIGKNLVERAGVMSANRFDVRGRNRGAQLAARLVALPSRLFDGDRLSRVSVGIALEVKKGA